ERIYRFEESGKKIVKTTDLAKDLGVSPASVTEMISGPLKRKSGGEAARRPGWVRLGRVSRGGLQARARPVRKCCGKD
ncbi:MAG: hypothetical protein ACTSRV_16940, partial [Candidatus Freyarchaeota archaeon]